MIIFANIRNLENSMKYPVYDRSMNSEIKNSGVTWQLFARSAAPGVKLMTKVYIKLILKNVKIGCNCELLDNVGYIRV
jgi:hypothetical protein